MRKGFEKGRCPLCSEEDIIKMFGNEDREGTVFK
jgi:Zn ribbon nucleic-acid-binding protein